MTKFRVHVVSLVLLVGLTSMCAGKSSDHKGLRSTQNGTSLAAALVSSGHIATVDIIADGGDPAPLPMPLPGAPKPPTKPPSFARVSQNAGLTDGGDPAPLPMPLPRFADGGDPAPLPMPLPGAPKPPTKPPSFARVGQNAGLTDGGDPAPLPMPLPRFADGGDPAPLPMPLPGAPKPPTKPPSFARVGQNALLTDGGDPAPLPMPLPRFADGGDPAPLPMPLPRFADGGDPAPLPMPLPHGPHFA